MQDKNTARIVLNFFYPIFLWKTFSIRVIDIVHVIF